MEYLIGVIITLLGALYYNITKRKSAEAIVNNESVRENLTKENEKISTNDGLEKAQESLRSDLENQNKKIEQGKDENIDPKSLVDFFNGN